MAEGQHSAYIVIEGPGHEGTRLALREGITSFGRLPANDLILLGDLVSRHHARITFFEGRATLQDLGSHNGSWVNGERTSSRILKDGDLIRIGNFRITFHQGSMAAALDETTAGERSAASPSPSGQPFEEDRSLVEEIEAARRGATSPARAVHFLYRASDALGRASDAQRYVEEMLGLALEHVPADFAGWIRPSGTELIIAAVRSPDEPAQKALPGAQGIPSADRLVLSGGPTGAIEVFTPAVRWVIDKRFGLRSDDLEADPRFADRGRTGRAPRDAVLVVPVVERDETSALYLRRAGGRFEPGALPLLVAVAHLMGEGLGEVARRQAELAVRLLDGLHGPRAALHLSRASASRRPSVEGPRPAAIALFDLHGLAPTAVDKDPHAVFAFLADTHEDLVGSVERAGGLAEILNGHRVLAAFGLGDDATQVRRPASSGLRPEGIAAVGRLSARGALSAALHLRASVDARLRAHPEVGPRRLRAGIASGDIIAGASGRERRSFGVLGPPVSMAARLVDAAGPGRLLVDEATLEAAGEGFDCRPVGTQPGRGSSPPQRVFELLGSAAVDRA